MYTVQLLHRPYSGSHRPIHISLQDTFGITVAHIVVLMVMQIRMIVMNKIADTQRIALAASLASSTGGQ